MGSNPRLASAGCDGLDLSFLDSEASAAVSVLRAHAPSAGRRVAFLARLGARRTIADLDLTYYLPCTVRGRTIAYLGVSRTDGRRLPFERGRGTADHPGRLRGHRHRKRLAVPLAAAQGGGVRAAEGVQREHRRIHQRGHPGGRPGRPRGELEHADRAAQRDSARARRGPAAERAVSRRAGRAVRPRARRNRHPPHLQVRA